MSNTRKLTKPKILYLSYNQDFSCINCGTTEGFVIYNINPFKIRYQQNFGKGIGIAEIFYTSNLIALVGGGDNPKYSTNKLVIWDDFQGKKFADITAEYRIVGVKLNKEHLAVVCQNSVKIYQFQDMKFITKIETYDNPHGICALSMNPQNNVIVTPGIEPGYVNIVHYDSNVSKTIKCHDNILRNITLNHDATKFATASSLGTLIRVFDIQTHTKFSELRRGSGSCDIFSINFSKDTKCLTLTSSKNTIHIYSLCKEHRNTKSNFKAFSIINGFFKSEWSLFSLPWNSLEITHDTKEFNPMMAKHISAITQCDEKKEMYNIFTVGYDGQYNVHQFQFSPTKIEKLANGKLSD